MSTSAVSTAPGSARPDGGREPRRDRPGRATRLAIDLRGAAGLATSVVRLLRHPLGLSEAREELARRLAQREQDFLALAREAIYGHPAGVYRRLLRHAGCEYGDLERLVCQKGLEATLRELLRQGVYLSVDEGTAKTMAADADGGIAAVASSSSEIRWVWAVRSAPVMVFRTRPRGSSTCTESSVTVPDTQFVASRS